MRSARRIVLAKIGLDGHDRGIRMIARELRDRGAEVILLGTGHTPEMVARVAVHEDANAIGVSILSGAHLTLVPRLLTALKEEKAEIPVLCGGTIPKKDQVVLLECGVRSVLSVGSTVKDAADALVGACTMELNT